MGQLQKSNNQSFLLKAKDGQQFMITPVEAQPITAEIVVDEPPVYQTARMQRQHHDQDLALRVTRHTDWTEQLIKLAAFGCLAFLFGGSALVVLVNAVRPASQPTVIYSECKLFCG